jgi:hypothetical protein
MAHAWLKEEWFPLSSPGSSAIRMSGEPVMGRAAMPLALTHPDETKIRNIIAGRRNLADIVSLREQWNVCPRQLGIERWTVGFLPDKCIEICSEVPVERVTPNAVRKNRKKLEYSLVRRIESEKASIVIADTKSSQLCSKSTREFFPIH